MKLTREREDGDSVVEMGGGCSALEILVAQVPW